MAADMVAIIEVDGMEAVATTAGTDVIAEIALERLSPVLWLAA